MTTNPGLNIGYHKPLPAAPKKPKLRGKTRRRLRIIRTRTTSLPPSGLNKELKNQSLPKFEEEKFEEISSHVPTLGLSYSDISPRKMKSSQTIIIFDRPLILLADKSPDSSGSGNAVYCNYSKDIQNDKNSKPMKDCNIVNHSKLYSPSIITPAQPFHIRHKINKKSKPRYEMFLCTKYVCICICFSFCTHMN